jgi:hypothetical protein
VTETTRGVFAVRRLVVSAAGALFCLSLAMNEFVQSQMPLWVARVVFHNSSTIISELRVLYLARYRYRHRTTALGSRKALIGDAVKAAIHFAYNGTEAGSHGLRRLYPRRASTGRGAAAALYSRRRYLRS